YLYVFGDNVEAVFQRIMQKKNTTINLYAVFYLTAGVFAAAVHATFIGWGSVVLMLGASGAISGVLGFYVVLFPKNRVWLREVGEIPAMLFILLWIGSNIVSLLMGSSIAVMAHLGGLFYGALVALILKKVGMA
ncbi:MAG: rhomboid family intramembrane serine protease, partial [Candidatus Caldarchaeum sp.]